MRHSRLVLLAAVTSVGAEAQAQEEEPDLGFLEYLGSWQEGDEEWLIVADIEAEPREHGEALTKDGEPVEDERTEESDETDDN